MSNKANNLAIVDQIKTLIDGIKLEGDADHDAVCFFYNDRVDHDDKPDDMTNQGMVGGCPCTLAHSIIDMERHHRPFMQAMESREQLNNPLFALFGALTSMARKARHEHADAKKEQPKPAADETAKATTDGDH